MDDIEQNEGIMGSKFEVKAIRKVIKSVKSTAGFHPIKDFYILNHKKRKDWGHYQSTNIPTRKQSIFENDILKLEDEDCLLEASKQSHSSLKDSSYHVTKNDKIAINKILLSDCKINRKVKLNLDMNKTHFVNISSLNSNFIRMHTKIM